MHRFDYCNPFSHTQKSVGSDTNLLFILLMSVSPLCTVVQFCKNMAQKSTLDIELELHYLENLITLSSNYFLRNIYFELQSSLLESLLRRK